MGQSSQERTLRALTIREQAQLVRKLFTADQATRRAFGGPPYTEDLIAELKNESCFDRGVLSKRGRIRLGEAKWNFVGKCTAIAYLGITVVNKARPTQYERRYVWAERAPASIDGIFIRRLVVERGERSKGYGKILLNRALERAAEIHKRLYCDTKADNAAMRGLAESLGGTINMFWNTPSGTLMVRYIWL